LTKFVTKNDRLAADRYLEDPEIQRFRQIFDLLEHGQPGKMAFGSMVEEFTAGENAESSRPGAN
jgi:hypothetical protein